MEPKHVSMPVIVWALVMSALGWCKGISLTCSDTAGRELKDIYQIYGCIPFYNTRSNTVMCHAVISIYIDIYVDIVFSLLQEIPQDVDIDIGNIAHCVGIDNFTLTLVGNNDVQTWVMTMYTVGFDPSMAVGVLRADRREWESDRTSNISLLSEVLELSVMDLFANPWYVYFWNFSSPFYGLELGWFRTLSVYRGGGNMTLAWLEFLQNTSIQKLNMSDMSEVETDTLLLKGMPLLRDVILDGNNISFLHEDCFTGTPKIETLILHNTRLDGIPPAIGRAPKLRILDISSASWDTNFTITTNVLSDLKLLEELNLGDNRIFSISGTLPYLPNLRKLSFYRCKISVIQEDDFTNTPALEKLNLRGNALTSLKAAAFSYVRNLTVLDLSQNNKLTDWPLLHGCSMDALDLSQNALTYFQNLGNLGTTVEILNVSFNRIANWDDAHIFSSDARQSHVKPPDSLDRPYTSHSENKSSSSRRLITVHLRNVREDTNFSPWVRIIDLSNNAIVGVSDLMVQSLAGLQKLDLGGNHFDCVDCRMIPFQRWLNTTSTTVTNLGTSQHLLCSSPINLKGYPVAQVEFDEEPCLDKRHSLWVLVIIPVGTTSIICTLAVAVIYNYRSQLTYILHLYRIRRRARNFSQTAFNKYAFDAFICYSSADRRFVLTRLAPILEKGPERYIVCLHERDFPLGSRIVDNIVGSIQHSRKTIIVLSENFVNSKWCKWELDMANHRMFNEDEHFVILIQLQNIERSSLSRHLQFLMDTRTFLEWPAVGHENEDRIVERLKRALGPSIFQTTNERAPLLPDVMEEY